MNNFKDIMRARKRARSISQLLERAETYDDKVRLVEDWLGRWKYEQTKVISRLGKANADDNFDEMCIAIGELQKITERRFDTVGRVFKKMLALNE